MPSPMKSVIAAVLAIGLSVPALAAEQDAGTVVATVGETEITLGEMIMMASQLPQEYQALPDDVLFNALLDELVRQTAVANTLDGAVPEIARIALLNERRAILASAAMNEIATAAVTDEAIADAYQAQYANAEPETEYNASHILVETEEEAAELKAALDTGADFAELAKEKSTGPSGPSGGELGWFTAGMMVKPFEDAVMSMEAGTVSDPVETQFGWHVIRLNETRDKPAPELDAVRGEIAGALQKAAVEAAVAKITEEATVTRTETEIDPAALRNMQLLTD
ncbi:MAG: peptidylprolyl isomerase [Pseudomonadota bacterium]|nr:peptidylprolyl isomerase [Pseudomonadota bacterium]